MHLTNQTIGLKNQSSRKVFTRKVPFFFSLFHINKTKKVRNSRLCGRFFYV